MGRLITRATPWGEGAEEPVVAVDAPEHRAGDEARSAEPGPPGPDRAGGGVGAVDDLDPAALALLVGLARSRRRTRLSATCSTSLTVMPANSLRRKPRVSRSRSRWPSSPVRRAATAALMSPAVLDVVFDSLVPQRQKAGDVAAEIVDEILAELEDVHGLVARAGRPMPTGRSHFREGACPSPSGTADASGQSPSARAPTRAG